MKLNLLAFAFLPGLCLAGYLVGNGAGAVWALGGWSGCVAAATAIHVVCRRVVAR